MKLFFVLLFFILCTGFSYKEEPIKYKSFLRVLKGMEGEPLRIINRQVEKYKNPSNEIVLLAHAEASGRKVGYESCIRETRRMLKFGMKVSEIPLNLDLAVSSYVKAFAKEKVPKIIGYPMLKWDMGFNRGFNMCSSGVKTAVVEVLRRQK